MELERKKNVGENKNKDDKFNTTEKANMASNVTIEDLSGEDGDVLCITHDAFIAHVQMQITHPTYKMKWKVAILRKQNRVGDKAVIAEVQATSL